MGLVNMGLTCYMNVSLQCLCACSTLSHYIMNNEYDDTLILEYKAFLKSSINELGNEPFVPTKIKLEISKVDEEFKDNKQKDCYQFLLTLINEISSRISHSDDHFSFQSRALGKSITIDEAIAEGISKVSNSNAAITTSLFTVISANIIACKKCKGDRIKLETSFSLSLPIPNKKTPQLEECINEYTSVQQLNGNNKIYCSVCKDKVDGEMCMQLVSLPPYLLLYFKKQKLKRINVTEKNTTHIEYPISIDFTKYMSISNSTYVLKNLTKFSPRYKLLGTVFHMGTIDEGHYTCLIRKENAWYYCDDSRIKQVSRDEYKNNNEVVLLYEREGIDKIASKDGIV